MRIRLPLSLFAVSLLRRRITSLALAHLRVAFFLASAALPIAFHSAGAQVADPVPGSIPMSDQTVFVEEVLQLPDSGPPGNPRARPMTLIGDGSGRTFVADQNGQILQLLPGGGISVFFDLAAARPLLADQGQRGLNSFAFHPDYHRSGAAGEGKIYTASSEPLGTDTPDFPAPTGATESHDSVLIEWSVGANPDSIDPGSARELIRLVETYNDHNMAELAFDPNRTIGDSDYGLLFIAVGDGGNVCCPRPSVDPWFVGQDLSSPLGTLLRIDPLAPADGASAYTVPADNPFVNDGDPDTLGEIWAFGLRNPHRFSWDRGGEGRMLISDIGQANIEEINLGEIGQNYGWSEREGTFLVMHFNENDVFALPPDDASLGYRYPVMQYDHDEGDVAVSAGYVVRGGGLGGALEGEYLFGDLRSGRIFHAPVASLDGSGQMPFRALRLIDASDGNEKSLLAMIGGDGSPAPRADLRFGLDDFGRIHLVTKRDGTVRRLANIPLVPAVPALHPLLMIALAGLMAIAGMSQISRTRRSGADG